jgi:hypothetical protein
MGNREESNKVSVKFGGIGECSIWSKKVKIVVVINKWVDDVPDLEWRWKVRAEIGINGLRFVTKLVGVFDATSDNRSCKEDGIVN